MMIFMAMSIAAIDDCASYQTTYEINQCLMRELKIADDILTNVYGVVVANAKAADATLDRTRDKRIGNYSALVRAERAWITFRDTHCVSMAYTMRGGSGDGTASAVCQIEMTELRIKQLRELVGE